LATEVIAVLNKKGAFNIKVDRLPGKFQNLTDGFVAQQIEIIN